MKICNLLGEPVFQNKTVIGFPFLWKQSAALQKARKEHSDSECDMAAEEYLACYQWKCSVRFGRCSQSCPVMSLHLDGMKWPVICLVGKTGQSGILYFSISIYDIYN